MRAATLIPERMDARAMSRRAAVALAAFFIASALAPVASAAEANNSTSSPTDYYLQGTRDPENRVWWFASLALLVVILVAALWFMRVIPR